MRRGPIPWRKAEVRELAWATPRVRLIRLHVPDWPGHLAGQHVDLRLTAEDGYQAQRSYSIATGPEGNGIELAVERASGWRGLDLPGRRAPRRRHARAPRSTRRLLHLAGRAGWATRPGRRWKRGGPADGHGAAPRRAGEQRPDPAPVLPGARSRTSSSARSSIGSGPRTTAWWSPTPSPARRQRSLRASSDGGSIGRCWWRRYRPPSRRRCSTSADRRRWWNRWRACWSPSAIRRTG